jgi:phosphomannomutase
MDEARAKAGVVCGYEANGGFLLGSTITRGGRELAALPTRDAALPIISVLAAAKHRSVADLCADLPQRVTWSDRLKDFATADSQAVLAFLTPGDEGRQRTRIQAHFQRLAGELMSVDRTDGLRMSFAGGDVIHLRPSGNAPELRCYTEADAEERARSLNAGALSLVRDELLKVIRAPPDRG